MAAATSPSMRHQRRLARIGGALLTPSAGWGPTAAAAAGGSYADLLRLDGRVVVVTGAAQGIGAEVARAFAETGARVAVLDRDGAAATATAQAIGAGAQAWECDVGVKAQVESVMQEVKSQLGSVDILVSNAGIHRRVDPVDFDEQDVDDIFTVNMKGTLNACGAAGRKGERQHRAGERTRGRPRRARPSRQRLRHVQGRDRRAGTRPCRGVGRGGARQRSRAGLDPDAAHIRASGDSSHRR